MIPTLQMRNKSKEAKCLSQISQAARSGPDPDAKPCSTGKSTSFPSEAWGPNGGRRELGSQSLLFKKDVSAYPSHITCRPSGNSRKINAMGLSKSLTDESGLDPSQTP